MDKLIVNFGGPRELEEIAPFLRELLCDRDVIQTKMPPFLHTQIFSWVAKRRARRIRHDYAFIGGRSPIFFDTERLGQELGALTFHRYLPATHEASLAQIESSASAEIRVLPMFPQFTFATTGSVARFFSERLSQKALRKLRWIKSYATEPGFITSYQKKIDNFLKAHDLREEETFLFFSPHGVPEFFRSQGDPYPLECEISYQEISKAFPKAGKILAYQSKFGRGEWVRPYTIDVCREIKKYSEDRKHVVLIPLSFTTDHIETLFEMETQYLPVIREQGLHAYRCPALNFESYWIQALQELFHTPHLYSNEVLIRSC
jgi:ferrochelatase